MSMVRAYHVILSAYGFWLPNDPRGSWSSVIRKWELLRYGPATKVSTRRSVAGRPHDRALRLAAKEALAYPAVHFDGYQARAIARGFAAEAEKCGYTVWACAVLPEHTHLVIARHRYEVEKVVNRLKGGATKRLREEGLHPLERYASQGKVPRCWAQREWKVFLFTEEDIRRAIGYVERNPLKEGKRPQEWGFVLPYPRCAVWRRPG